MKKRKEKKVPISTAQKYIWLRIIIIARILNTIYSGYLRYIKIKKIFIYKDILNPFIYVDTLY